MEKGKWKSFLIHWSCIRNTNYSMGFAELEIVSDEKEKSSQEITAKRGFSFQFWPMLLSNSTGQGTLTSSHLMGFNYLRKLKWNEIIFADVDIFFDLTKITRIEISVKKSRALTTNFVKDAGGSIYSSSIDGRKLLHQVD